jgi:hypothetical protein
MANGTGKGTEQHTAVKQPGNQFAMGVGGFHGGTLSAPPTARSGLPALDCRSLAAGACRKSTNLQIDPWNSFFRALGDPQQRLW